jgi:tetratricopeptide (TPR) repeat protein
VTPQPPEPLELFYSYSHKDEELRDQLDNHLAMLKRDGVISGWHDRRISAGQEWDGEIDEHLSSAEIILLLVSADFLTSNYCYDIEVKRAMARHEAHEAQVVPVILRPCDWNSAPFGKVQALPKDAKPVTRWADRDEAFLDIAKGIRSIAQTPAAKSHKSLALPASIPRPPVVGFVARRDDDGRDIVERLKEELAPRKNQLIVLSGPGGVGKTTLAAEATRALSEGFGQRIVWASALGREDFALSVLLDEISTQLGHPEIRPLAPGSKAEAVQALIASAPPLIILDNFETIPEVEQTRCVEFLLNRASCPALVTTRQKIASARNITIPVMSPEEADDFSQRLIEQAIDPFAFAQLDRDRIMTASERNPLIMQWVMGQIDLAQDADTVLNELAQGVGDAAQRVFDRSFGLAQLGDDGRATLLALSLFAPDASRPALAQVAGFGDDLKRLSVATKSLAGLYLVKGVVEGSRLTVAGLTRELTKARLSKDEHADEFRQRVVAYFLSYAKAHAQPTPEDYDALETEKDNVLTAMDVAFGIKDWVSVTQLMDAINSDGVNGYLTIRGHWDEAVRRGEQALKAGRELSDERQIAFFSHNLAITYESRGEFAEARRLYNESLEIVRKLGHQTGISSTLHQLATLVHYQGDLDEARRLYNESLEIVKELGDQSGISITLHQLAILAYDQGDLDEAGRLHNESLAMKKRLGDQGGIAQSLHELALLAQGRGELGEARRLYNEGLEIKKKLGNQGGIAISLGGLATLAEEEGNNEEAARLFGEAVTIFEKLKSPHAEIARRHLEIVKRKSS